MLCARKSLHFKMLQGWGPTCESEFSSVRLVLGPLCVCEGYAGRQTAVTILVSYVIFWFYLLLLFLLSHHYHH